MKSAETTGEFDAVMPDAPLVACVSAMQRFCTATRIVECLVLGASAAGLVLGAAAWSGSRVLSVQGLVAACFSAAAAAMSWWLTDPRDRLDVARLVDQRCELGGAVITAYEREISGDRRPLSRELSRRTVAKVDVGALRRSLLQRRIGILAVPCISFALWTIAVDEATRASPERDVAELLGSIADRAADLENTASRHGASDRVDAQSSSEVAKLARLARSARDEPHTNSARALENVRALQHQVEQVSAWIPPSEELHRSVSRVRASVDAARVKLEHQDPASHARIAGERQPALALEESTRRDQDANRGSTDVSAEGSTKSTSDADASQSSSPARGLDSRDRRDEPGVVGGMWWSARYDSVVERWVEMRRTARNASR